VKKPVASPVSCKSERRGDVSFNSHQFRY
jgi:hypothetical protein